MAPLIFLIVMSAWTVYEDFKAQAIPDFIHVGLITFAFVSITTQSNNWIDMKSACIGLLVGGSLMFATALFGCTGGGDVKLVGALGTWFGMAVIEVVLLSYITGVFFVIPYYLKHRESKQKIPFGPPIVIAAIVIWQTDLSLFAL